MNFGLGAVRVTLNFLVSANTTSSENLFSLNNSK